MWFAVTAAINSGLVMWSAGHGGVGGRAVDWSLAAFCIAVAARHDGIVRGVFVLGRLVPSYRLHQLTYHLGQLHRAMAIAGMAWLAVAVTLAVPSAPVARIASVSVLAILTVMARTARDRVRQSQHNRFESVHRLGGWAALGILSVIVPVEAARSLPPGSSLAGLLRQPSVLLLGTLVTLVAHPWLGVRRLPAEFLAVTSEVIVVALPGRRLLGEFVRVSREGHEWHSFAVATTGREGPGRYCLVIRRAGDWTERLARDVEHRYVPGAAGHRGGRRRRGAPVRRRVRSQQRRGTGRRCPSVRIAWCAVVRSHLRLIGQAGGMLLAMRAYFCGTRGSTPVSGAEHLHYGGHTSCLGLAHSGEPPTIVLDAGTGLQQLSRVLRGRAFRGTLLLSHLHWDHTHGMPFFRSGTLPGSRVDVYLPEQGVEPEELLARAISPPHFPIRPKQLGVGWTFNAIEPGHHEFEGFSVDALEIPHKGGRTFGYRVSDGSGTLAYLPDHNPISLGPGPDGTGVFHEAAIMLTEGADLLVHDSQHTAAELPRLGFLGHSAVEYAAALAHRANARQFVLFHHDPWRTDAEIDALVAQYAAASVRVFAAHDGMVVNLP